MAEISAAVNFTSQEKSLIESKLKDPAFTHANWQDEDLVALRCAARCAITTEMNKLVCAPTAAIPSR